MVVLYHQPWASIRYVNSVLKNSLFLSEYQYIWIYVSFHCFFIISIFFFLKTNAFFCFGFYFLFYMHVFVMVDIDNVLILIIFYLVYTCTWVFFMKKRCHNEIILQDFFIVHQLQQSSPTHFIRINYCRSYNLTCCPFLYLSKISWTKSPSINKHGINSSLW